MEIVSYNWGDESTNQVGICISDPFPPGNKVMVWCDEDDWELEGLPSDRQSKETAMALGEVLYQMIGGYR